MSPYDMHLHIHIAYICSMMHEPWPPCPMTHVHAMSHVPCHILTMIRASFTDTVQCTSFSLLTVLHIY